MHTTEMLVTPAGTVQVLVPIDANITSPAPLAAPTLCFKLFTLFVPKLPNKGIVIP
jgi:hypothetical protein